MIIDGGGFPMFDNKNFNNSISFDKETVEQLKNGANPNKLLNQLSEEQKQKLNSVLNDKKALESILKSPQALALLKMFGGDKNG